MIQHLVVEDGHLCGDHMSPDNFLGIVKLILTEFNMATSPLAWGY